MANVDVKKQSSEDKSVQRTTRDPWLSGWPSDWFGSDSFSLMRRFRDEMDQTFGRFFGGESERSWVPAIDVTERDGRLHVHADLPGMKPDDVKVEVTDRALVIRGERKYEYENKEGGVYRSERRYGRFYREIPLPQGVDTEQAKADFHDGVLEVSVPLPEQKSNRRQVPISSGR